MIYICHKPLKPTAFMLTIHRYTSSVIQMKCCCYRSFWVYLSCGCVWIIFNWTLQRPRFSDQPPVIDSTSCSCRFVLVLIVLHPAPSSGTLAFFIDADKSMRAHVVKMISSCFATLHQIQHPQAFRVAAPCQEKSSTSLLCPQSTVLNPTLRLFSVSLLFSPFE